MASVLVVDDDEAIRWVVRETLEEAGHRVSEATSGEEALGLLRGGQGPVVVLVDLLMAGMGGAGLLTVLAGDPMLREQCACVLTKASIYEPDLATRNYLAVPPLAKPFDLDDLLLAVERAAMCLEQGATI